MTIRNAVPRFGIRWAVVLAAVAAVVIAALLAVGSPASAQSSDDKEIWSATMTVGMFPIGPGFRNSDIGALSDDHITIDEVSSEINLILDSAANDGKLLFGIDERLDSTEELTWTLHVDGRTFDFNDATYSTDSTYDHVYTWSITNNRFGWAVSDEVAVKITEKKSISVEAGHDHGGIRRKQQCRRVDRGVQVHPHREHRRGAELHAWDMSRAERRRRASSKPGYRASATFHWAIDVWTRAPPTRSAEITWEILSPVPGYIISQRVKRS